MNNLTYVITDVKCGNRPIICSSSQEKATQDLFDYMGYSKEQSNIIYHGYKIQKYSDEENEMSFMGTYKFESCYKQKAIKVFEMDIFNLYELVLDANQKIN
jgi:hypothetical protein